jgi:hypothetical protein
MPSAPQRPLLSAFSACCPLQPLRPRLNLPSPPSQWAQCIFVLKQNLIAATCIAAMMGTLIMALVANMPVAIAPAMGVNAFFTYK